MRAGLRNALRGLVVAGFAVANVCALAISARADGCPDMKSQYAAAFRAYQALAFHFPEDCTRVGDYVRNKRAQAQSLVALSHSADRACGGQAQDHDQPIEQLVLLLDHDIARLQAGCDLILGSSLGAPPAAAAPGSQPPPASQAPPANQPPPASPAQTMPAPATTGVLGCAAQKAVGIAPGCNADFPQRQTGAACTAADNSVGLTLQVPGAEPSCCINACARSK